MGEAEWLPLGPSNELFSARRPPTGDPTDGVRRAPYSIRIPPVKALLAAARRPPGGRRLSGQLNQGQAAGTASGLASLALGTAALDEGTRFAPRHRPDQCFRAIRAVPGEVRHDVAVKSLGAPAAVGVDVRRDGGDHGLPHRVS